MTKVEALEVDYEPQEREESESIFKPVCSFCGDTNEIEDSCILQEKPAEKPHPQRAHESPRSGLYYACKSCIDIYEAAYVDPQFEDYYVCDRCEIETEMGPEKGHEYDVFEIEPSETFEDVVTILGEPYTTRHLCADCWTDLGIFESEPDHSDKPPFQPGVGFDEIPEDYSGNSYVPDMEVGDFGWMIGSGLIYASIINLAFTTVFYITGVSDPLLSAFCSAALFALGILVIVVSIVKNVVDGMVDEYNSKHF